jgi:eukaryotic-like serine/threonine-protein kinase
MGRVWLARDEILHRDVAVKELLPPGPTSGGQHEMRERSMREARAIAQLDHPNVVRIFDVLHADGEPWIVMEFVPSRSLDVVLSADGPLAPAEVVRIGLAVLAALLAAHGCGLLHRDVKPANVLLADDGRVVLTDFGLAHGHDDPGMTETGIVLGSPSYLAPERAADGEVGPAADLWSLGATLYTAVEGRPPYVRSSTLATLAALATEPPTPPERAGALAPVLEGLLRKEPSQRIRAEEAERLLRQAADQLASPADAAAPASTTPLPTTTATAAKKRRRWLIAAGAAAVAAALVAVIAVRVSNTLTDHAAVTATSMRPDPAALTGWGYYTQDPDFSVPVPDGWQQLHEGQHVEFYEPGGARVLVIDKLGAPKADLLADARAIETADRETGRYPHYEPIGISAVNYQARAVDREWTYAEPGGMRMHAVSRTFVAENGQGYRVDWTTPDTAWTASKAALLRILAGFHTQQVLASSDAASPSARSSSSRSIRPSASAKPTSPPARPVFTDRPIINLDSGRCIDIPGGNPDTMAEIQMWDCFDSAEQKFTFLPDNTLRAVGKCLEIRSISNGSNLRIASCTGEARQRFNLNSSGDLVSLSTGKCIDAKNGDPLNGVWLQIWDCTGAANHKWYVG